jgi:cellulose synthase/poly-beta-1,6-N-acetylglucosamine synthase-like glycosyltransferase
MNTGLLTCFILLATLLWLSSFGYLMALSVVARFRRRRNTAGTLLPRIAVVVPTLNEERFIRSKLNDLRRTDYPCDHMTVVVADGGSRDATATLVQRELEEGAALCLLRLPGSRSKADQIKQALSVLDQEIILITDADARLEPSCIRELVTLLMQDPLTGLVGATVQPHTQLLEERIHWWFLNYLWWLEGEVLSSALVSGVCFAARREVLQTLLPGAATEDAHLALAAGAHGRRVRICRRARATELRVPHTSGELVQFRLRRGSAYLCELVRSLGYASAPVGWKLSRHIRLWHFLVTPLLGAMVGLSALALLWTPDWQWPILAFAAFAGPAVATLFISSTLEVTASHCCRLSLAATRLLALTWISLALVARSSWIPLSSGDPT